MLLITDLDGTLLDDDKNITKVDLDAIKKWQAAGNLFTFATGRAIKTSIKYAKDLDLNLPAVVFNGSVIYDFNSETTIYETPLADFAPDVVKFVLETYPNVGVTVQTISEMLTIRSNNIIEHLLIVENTPRIDITPDEIPGRLFKVLFALPHDKVPALSKALKERWGGKTDFIHSNINYFEMIPIGECKGTAVKKLADHIEYSGKIAAIGDFDNDITMLKGADYSACPSGAKGTIRETAQTILKSGNGGAVAEFIDLLMNGN
jgi:HAD-superfamily hydrolase, subfamily IIB